ncbi:MAG: pseudouridine synthase [bacterium]|nr:pseudouridine synthase [bacterium]
MLPILYQDDHYVAVDKPTGMFVHPTDLGRGQASCMVLLRNHLGQWVYPVHRLDRATSGVLIFALDQDAAGRMGRLFEQRLIQKTYLAVVRGYTLEQGQIDYAYPADDAEEAVDAMTEYDREATVELPFPVGRYDTARYSLVRVKPHTGRRHQIRRHFAHMDHPLVGDRNYGDHRHNRLFKEKFRLHRLLLMATELSFVHPYSDMPVCIQGGIPGKIALLFRRFGWEAVLEAREKGKDLG